MQFRDVGVEYMPSDFESLLMQEKLTKPLSVTYKVLLKTPQVLVRCREKWEAEVPDIQVEDWDDLWT